MTEKSINKTEEPITKYQRYEITLKGVQPLLMHRDNMKWAERVAKWTKDPAHQEQSIPGDDRTPAWTWLGRCYFANSLVVIESDNLMSMLRDAGKRCRAAKGKGSLKAATQSGIVIDEIGWPLIVKGHTIPEKTIMDLANEEDFAKHKKMAEANDFELFEKRAKIGKNRHVRVRPRFDYWVCKGTITVLDTTLTKEIIEILFNQAGRFIGLCDWRPGSPASGHFGMFESSVKEL